MARLFLSLLLMSALCIPAAAFAQADKVWVDCRHGESFNCPYLAELEDFETAMYDAGASNVMISTELPADVGDGSYRLLVIILPTLELGVPELQMVLPGFLAAGGRLVLLAENDGDWMFNAHIQAILDSIPDHTLALGADDINQGCDNETTMIQGDPLTTGLTNWHFARTNTVTGGDPLIRFARSDGGEGTLAAVARLGGGGDVVLFGDIEGFVMNCATQDAAHDWSDDHRQMWMNLFIDGSATPDGDGDGFTADEDCDDDDPYIHPNADEDCDNGVDDDCDGQVDTDDTDCAGDDDDDAAPDDDDAATDDDDVSPLDDDDDAGFDDDWNDGCCSQSIASPGRSLGAGALVMLLGLVALARRRS
jgi:hypothetical protein